MKTFTLFLATLLLAAIPLKGFCYTDNQIVKFGQIYYKVVSASDHTLAYLGVDDDFSGKLVIPKTVGDGIDATFTVVGIEYNALYRSFHVTEAKLPETITYLDGFSFAKAPLERVNIPKNVNKIHPNVWANLQIVPKCNVSGENKSFRSDADGAMYSKDWKTLHSIPSKILTAGNSTYAVSDKVEYILRAAFRNVKGLNKIIFPKNLKKVMDGYPTIAPTEGLREIEVASGGNTIYHVIDNVLFEKDTLMLYPRGKTTTYYKIPDNIAAVAQYAISSNKFLKAINFNKVEKMETSCAYGLEELQKVTFPALIKPYDYKTGMGMKEGCFESCPMMETFIVPSANKYLTVIGGVLFSKDTKRLYCYPGSKPQSSYTVPSHVTTIAARAFQSVPNLKKVVVGNNVDTISVDAFRSMPLLEDIIFSKNSKVSVISDYAFRDCQSLVKVTLPKRLSVVERIFHQCDNLEVINVPDGSLLTEIRPNAFFTNKKLKAFNFLGSCTLTKIAKDVFANLTALESFAIPKSVTNIESNAFRGCSNMKTVTFDPDAEIAKIGEGAFADCGIVTINIPKNVTKIEREAFMKCEALTEINITKTTTDISPEAFKQCTNLIDINVDRDNAKYSSIDGYLLSKDKETLKIFPTGKANDHFTLLPPSITAIGEYAFYDCKKLTNVTIPNKVKTIGKRAFGLCDNLNTVTFLCDEMIDPSKIMQGENDMSFDADPLAVKPFGKINIYVRKDKLGQYQSNSFYNKFASISPSFGHATEEYIAVSEKAVDLLSTTSTDHTFMLPTTIEYKGKPYEVNLIGDFAFENAPASLQEVVVRKHVKYIGAKAFVAKSKNLKRVFFIESEPTKEMLGTTRFALDETGNSYNEFASDAKIYVKKSALEVYRTNWTKHVYNVHLKKEVVSPFNFTSQIEYRITDVQVKNKYSTFAREFDVDFGEFNETHGDMAVAAFVAGSKILKGGGDYGSATHHIRMTSIDKHGGVGNSYAYVPANTGVLLKIIKKGNDNTGGNLYYTIGENDAVTYNVTNNVMHGVTCRNADIEASSASPVYVLQKGVFGIAQSKITNFPVHKAYLKLEGAGAGAKLMLDFGDGVATAIDDVAVDEPDRGNDVFFNLNGQRVSNPKKGVYIRNGKKIIVR